jgi:hypothetical protein
VDATALYFIARDWGAIRRDPKTGLLVIPQRIYKLAK